MGFVLLIFIFFWVFDVWIGLCLVEMKWVILFQCRKLVLMRVLFFWFLCEQVFLCGFLGRIWIIF